MRKTVTLRTAERIHRAAYDFESLSVRLRAEGFEREGNGLKDVSRKLGDIARNLDDALRAT